MQRMCRSRISRSSASWRACSASASTGRQEAVPGARTNARWQAVLLPRAQSQRSSPSLSRQPLACSSGVAPSGRSHRHAENRRSAATPRPCQNHLWSQPENIQLRHEARAQGGRHGGD
jgi:hypothetical protein